MTEYKETRIEVEQTAAGRGRAIRDLTVQDRIEFRYNRAPEGVVVDSGVYADDDGWLFMGAGDEMRTEDGTDDKWVGSNPYYVLLAVIKRTPIPSPADAKPGEAWGDEMETDWRAVYLPDAVTVPRPWVGSLPGSRNHWHSFEKIEEMARDHGWVKLYEGGEEVAS
ncbi:MAG: hypothetical protein ACTJHU_00325 [Mycetocola sp.]